MRLIYTILILLWISIPCLGQENSKNNHEGEWKDNATWVDNSPAYQGDIFVYGDVYTLGESINLTNTTRLEVTDTLFIDGSLISSHPLTIVVNSGGILIIKGDLEPTSTFNMQNDGKMVVTGNFDLQGTNTMYNRLGAFYIFDDTPNYTTFTQAQGSQYGDEHFLSSNDPTLSSWVTSGPLPINSKSLTAAYLGDKVVLSIKSAESPINVEMKIEKSYDGLLFEILGEPHYLVSQNGYDHYTFTDKNYSDKNYYRLKEQLPSGEINTSEVIFLYVPKGLPITVFDESGKKLGVFNSIDQVNIYNKILIIKNKKIIKLSQ